MCNYLHLKEKKLCMVNTQKSDYIDFINYPNNDFTH